MFEQPWLRQEPPPTPAGAHPQAGHRLRFEGWLRRRVVEPIEVVWTQNRVRLASSARRGGRLVLRVHALFAHGGEAEAHDLVALLVHRERARGARLSLWFAEVRRRYQPVSTAPLAAVAAALTSTVLPLPTSVPTVHPPPTSALTEACVAAPHAHPSARSSSARHAAPLLAQLFAELNAAYFYNGCGASIRWGRGGTSTRRRRRSMQLGCYDFGRREIRIHPALNQPFVPRFVVALVVYHEMLHEVFGLEQRGSRRSAHPPEFVACEQSHPDYARARTWEQQNLGRLLAWRA